MAAILKTIYLTFLFRVITSYSVYSKLPEVYGENQRSHLLVPHIQKICESRDEVCKSRDTVVCTMRIINGSIEHRNFENSCFLFLSNMCDYPGEEYNIIEGISCESYLRRKNLRRSVSANATVSVNGTEATTSVNGSTHGMVNPTEPAVLRAQTVSRIYDIDTAFDFHACPLACPDTYSPVCVSANRGAGKYFKFFTFVNHCKGDVYYCKHFDEFSPPPDVEEEDVNSSGLSWSYCGAFRYLQFARFSEILSSMGHYGWLAGDQRFSAILEPYERRPGYG